jgi:3'-phosphoadenosine 5'-phosphosulfate sulfotransferase (PAPS reductase)/FAD synthetase
MTTELEQCVRSFFEDYLDHVEESDGGKLFHPIHISCSRVLKVHPLNNLLTKMRTLSGAKPLEEHDL